MLTTPTPGRQHTGRFAVLDDLALYGSQQAIALLASEGALGLFAHSAATVADFSDELLRVGVNATPHVWDLYHAGLNEMRTPVAGIHAAFPHASTTIAIRDDWGIGMTQHCQKLMLSCGVMPASLAVLRNQAVPSLLAIATDRSGKLAGVGSLVWGHCSQATWHGHAHLGMICVDKEFRGQSLGQRLAAALVLHAAQESHTIGITAACAADNPASAKLLVACGLHRDTTRMCVMFTLDGKRQTR